jgi:hypothetical protein
VVTSLVAVILIQQFNPLLLLRQDGTAYYTAGLMRENSPNVHYKVPLDVVIVNSEMQTVMYSESDYEAMVERANEIWREAGITLAIRSFVYKDVPDEQLKSLDSLDTEGLKQFGNAILPETFEDNVIDVIFLKSFSKGVSHRAVADGQIVSVFMTELEHFEHISWTFAHEIGHPLGLRDVFELDNLMIKADGSSSLRSWYRTTYLPMTLTEQQIAIVHNTIETKSLAHN